MNNSGIGRHVKNTDNNRNDFLPHTSDRAPSKGDERNDKIPYRPHRHPHQLIIIKLLTSYNSYLNTLNNTILQKCTSWKRYFQSLMDIHNNGHQ